MSLLEMGASVTHSAGVTQGSPDWQSPFVCLDVDACSRLSANAEVDSDCLRCIEACDSVTVQSAFFYTQPAFEIGSAPVKFYLVNIILLGSCDKLTHPS